MFLEQKHTQVFSIALAEATLDLIQPWVDAGDLPTFKKLMTHGAWGPLKSSVPFVTPQMWGTILTGTLPGKHGAFDFWQRGPEGDFKEINGSALSEPPIWDHLSDLGITSNIINVPLTYPPKNILGVMISGQDAPGAHRSIARPKEIYDDIVKRYGNYRLKDIFPGGRQKEDYLTLIPEDVAEYSRVVRYLLHKHPAQFFLTFTSATAMAQHYFWQDMHDEQSLYRNVIKEAYQALDKALAKYLELIGPNAYLFVFSECGAGPLRSGVQIDTWLRQQGFLFEQEMTSDSVEKQRKARESKIVMKEALMKWLPKWTYYYANKYLGAVKAHMEDVSEHGHIDWSKTRAFSRGKEGSIYINLKGRDPKGIVEPGLEYQQLCQQIKKQLLELVDPMTGDKPVEGVYQAHELFSGPLMEYAPDLTICWKAGEYMPTEDAEQRDDVFVARQRAGMRWPTTGSHRESGILFVHGPGVVPGKKIEGMATVDVMPTWLDLLGQKPKQGLDGKSFCQQFKQTQEK